MSAKKSDVASQVKQEHECLKRDLGTISREIKRDLSEEDFPDWHLEFIWRLRDFRLHLLKHFDLEEEGGFMDEILKEAPGAFNQVKKLEGEHKQFVTEIDCILDLLKELKWMDQPRVQEIKNRMAKLIDLLHSHEEEEDELMQTALYVDIGYPA